jgi:hypothetical protein
MVTREQAVRIGQEEVGRILSLKQNLDQGQVLVDQISQYQRMGWSLAVLDAETGQELGLDFAGPFEAWSESLSDLSYEGVQVNLGLRTGSPSQLLVLEVNQGAGALALDKYGEWRSDWVAEVGGSREQHYYTLPPGHQPPVSFFLAEQVMVFGEGGLVMAPPSLASQANEPWRWRNPPGKSAPGHPSPAVWKFLQDLTRPVTPSEAQVPSWEEVYRQISPHDRVLQALLAPAASMEDYYLELLLAAHNAGLKEQQFLLGLLWHAPQGDARRRPERWEYLQALVAQVGEERSATGGKAAPRLTLVTGGPPPPAMWPKESTEVLASVPRDQHPLAEANGRENVGIEGGPGRQEHPALKHFFHLLAALGERVIQENSRHDDPLFELGALAHHASELERDLTKGDQHLTAASDQKKTELVEFFLKNYININPELGCLPAQVKLERAAKMARDFLEKMVKVDS